ncbi:MAG TPA: S-adenosylmethionine decarboxylase [Gemmatimonadales bacterium]|nr:S-adenosylmethionine decarboxylase [Gemmatimonadales bacterium]
MSAPYHSRVVELTGVPAARLRDAETLAGLLVAAAGAGGLPTDGAPLLRESQRGISLCLLCRDGHIVVHTLADQGYCLIDLVTRSAEGLAKGIEVITRRLTRE